MKNTKRRFYRHSLQVETEARIENQDTAFKITINEISFHGIGFLTEKKLNVEDVLSIEITIPEAQAQKILVLQPVILRSRVVWQKHHSGHYSTGGILLFANPIIIKHILSYWKER